MKKFIATLVREAITAATKTFAEEGARKLATKWFGETKPDIVGIGTGPPKKEAREGCGCGHP